MRFLLIVHQGAIGDFILSLPAVEALHLSFPQARITFLANPSILDIVRGLPYVGEVLDCRSSRWVPLYQSGGRLSSAHLDSLLSVEGIFVFGRSSSQILADNLARILHKPAQRIDPFPESGLQLAATDYQCRQLEELGVPAIPPPTAVIAPAAGDLSEGRAFVHRNLKPRERLVLIHPGSGGREKLWSLAGWLGIIHKLTDQQNLRIGLIQGPADTDSVQHLQANLSGTSFLLIENWRLGKLAALLGQAALYLGNDSGVTHLAAACGTPTIALFGPTDPHIWAPRGPHVRIIHWQPATTDWNARSEIGQTPELASEVELTWEQTRRWLGV